MNTNEATQTSTGAEQPNYCYSLDQEGYSSEPLIDVLQRGESDELIGQNYWRGIAVHPNPSSFFDIDRLFEDIGERACDDHGEWAEDFPDVSDEKKAELNAIITEWLDKNIDVTFYAVTNVEELVVTESDLE
ncbi:hypothetical protein [Janthinobacterium sp. B9-8]|uniref:hypothetical protein n=1 Tax=Janthinobacterium sp. B9-8 TaxID=1236179 RepID=UPI00069AE98A|nr:hypothetical protein [Janthinobacterium sp. B9-8]AMC34766.1 hypothetical protein VN23_09160 [Janthinobacterium sp. B9-8]